VSLCGCKAEGSRKSLARHESNTHNAAMSSKLTRLIVLFAMLVCLPLQGLAAATMPACQADGKNMAAASNASQVLMMAGCDHTHDGATPTKKSPCDHCVSCQLSVTQAFLPVSPALGFNVAAGVVAAAPAQIPDSLPSSLFRPPRLTLA
jgi:hypothetical protein